MLLNAAMLINVHSELNPSIHERRQRGEDEPWECGKPKIIMSSKLISNTNKHCSHAVLADKERVRSKFLFGPGIFTLSVYIELFEWLCM